MFGFVTRHKDRHAAIRECLESLQAQVKALCEAHDEVVDELAKQHKVEVEREFILSPFFLLYHSYPPISPRRFKYDTHTEKTRTIRTLPSPRLSVPRTRRRGGRSRGASSGCGVIPMDMGIPISRFLGCAMPPVCLAALG